MITRLITLPALLLFFLIVVGILWLLIKLATKQSLPIIAVILAGIFSIIIMLLAAPAINIW